MIILVGFSPLVYAEDTRTIPLDMYLIIDGSQSFQNSKTEAIAWINNQVVDRILTEGDNITVWAAGSNSSLVHSGAISDSSGGVKKDLKDKLLALAPNAKTADFSSALREAASAAARTPQSRFSCIMLITASAEGLEGTLTGGAQNLLRWFRSEKYERWQVLIVAPDIAPRVKEAAASYMSSLR